ncbi:hypothetical protein [Variovorax atrisoli]|uniref:hypothetical protein n=1 Tax=Variovorax atrisoli TaxID=3394203 RepID=UPI0040400C5D
MSGNFDWRGNASLLIGGIGIVASVLVPLWLWRADLQAKSISIHVLSATALQQPWSGLDNLQVTLDGVQVKDAVVTTFQVINDGAKPIPASDFESAIRLHVGEKSKVVRAQVSDSAPKELPVVLQSDSSSVSVQPLLLNPGDSIKILLITSNGLPTLSTSGRIAGVSSIGLEFLRTEGLPLKTKILLSVLALLGVITYVGNMFSLWKSGFMDNAAGFKIISALAAGGLMAITTRMIEKSYGTPWNPPTWLGVALAICSALLFFILSDRYKSRRNH